MDRLHGLFRWTWVQNQRLVSHGRELIAALREAEIETLLLKGAALIMLDYQSAGMRPMADLDVLVHPERVEEAGGILMSRGWKSEPGRPPSRLAYLQADTFERPQSFAFELHWRTIMHREPELDLWARAVPVDFGGVETRALCATDRLLHVCVHGLTPAEPPAIRWVTDALAIMGRHQIEWPRLVDQARRREVTLVMGKALGYLSDAFQADIPAAVVAELERGPHSRLERSGYRAATGPWEVRGVLRWHWYLCRRLTSSRSRAALVFPSYLQVLLGYERRRDFARRVLRRLARGPAIER